MISAIQKYLTIGNIIYSEEYMLCTSQSTSRIHTEGRKKHLNMLYACNARTTKVTQSIKDPLIFVESLYG